jgi:hypothetical protein
MRLLLVALALAASIAATLVAVHFIGAAQPPQTIEAAIGEAHFSFPAALARDEETLAGGFVDRIALLATFPDFAPRPPPGKTKARPDLVFVTISPKDDSLEPSERPARLYARFLESEAFVGPGGLVMRRFEKGSPYDLEQLYIAPPDGAAFFARCPKLQEGEAPSEEPCLFVFRDGALDVELRFAPSLLEQWDVLNEGARAFFARLRAGAAKGKAPKLINNAVSK